MKRINVVSVKMVKEKTIPYEFKKVTNPAIAAVMVSEFLEGADREHAVVVTLDTKNNITGISTISVGSLSMAIIHPREVFKIAILNNAASIIFAHNHPSGDPKPSPEDIEISRKLAEVGEIVGIQLTDSLIVTDDVNNFVSLKQEGYI